MCVLKATGKAALLIGSIFCLIIFSASKVRSEQIEETAFDFYLGDKFKGVVFATYTEEWIKVTDPKQCLALLTEVKQIEKIQPLLAEKIFLSKEILKVGKISFSPKTFLLRLNVEPELLKANIATAKEQIEHVDSIHSLRQFLSFTGISGTEDASSIRSLSTMSLGEAWINSDFTLLQNQERSSAMDDASLNVIIKSFRASAGALQSRGDSLVPSYSFYGAGLYRNEAILTSEGSLRGSNFSVFVPARSRVEFYRSGRLIDVQILDFGLQPVDTSRFPQGSYLVDIVIREVGGGSDRRERQFYSKSGLLAMRDYPDVAFELGMLRDETTLEEDLPFYHGHVAWRAFDNAELKWDSYGLDSLHTTVFGTRMLIDEQIFGASVSYTNGESFGYSADLSGKIFDIELGGTFENSKVVEINDVPIPGDIDDRNPIELENSEEPTLIEGKLYTAYIGKRFDDLELRYEAYKNENKNEDAVSYYHGPVVRYRFFEDAKHRLSIELASYRTDQGDKSYAYLSYSLRGFPWTYEPQVYVGQDQNGADVRLVHSLNYDKLTSATGLGTRGQIREEAKRQNKSNSLVHSLEGRHGTDYGAVAFYGEHVESEKSTATHNIAGTLDLNILAGSDARTALAPGNVNQSFIIVDLSSIGGNEMEILLNGSPVAKTKDNKRVTIGINAYRTYKVQIRPTSKSPLVKYDTTVKEFNLYPGAVGYAEFKIQKVFLAIGKLVSEQGIILANTRIKSEDEEISSDEEGMFQIELKGTAILEAIGKESQCKFTLIAPEGKKYYKDYGEVRCFVGG